MYTDLFAFAAWSNPSVVEVDAVLHAATRGRGVSLTAPFQPTASVTAVGRTAESKFALSHPARLMCHLGSHQPGLINDVEPQGQEGDCAP